MAELRNFRTKPCPWCKETTTLQLDPTKVRRWQEGEFVQRVFPEMDADQRELLITGTHPKCWDLMFPEEDEEEG